MLAFTGELSFLIEGWKDAFRLRLFEALSLTVLCPPELECEESLVLSSSTLDTPSLLIQHQDSENLTWIEVRYLPLYFLMQLVRIF